ncbi:thymidylate kinase [Geitlerinema sp. PCC 7407]|nr:thymidylate kinase [Geitlerinema sp. PCC 7407]
MGSEIVLLKGKLIVFEGVEGAGKTTQIQRLRHWLTEGAGRDLIPAGGPGVVVTREPGGTALGTKLRRLLLEVGEEPMSDRAELLLYAADRAQHVEGFLRPLLAEGAIVLCDRFTDSTVAYQGFGRGLDGELIAQLNAIATAGLTSDVTLLLDLPVTVGLARTQRRGQADRMEQANQAFHERVQAGFRALAAAHPERMVAIDAGGSEAQVAQEIQTVMTERLCLWYPALAFRPSASPKPLS